MKLSILIFPQYNLFLNARHKKCVMKQLTDFCLYFILFLIGVKLKKCLTEFPLGSFYANILPRYI